MPMGNSLVAALAIAGVLAVGWTVAVVMLGRVLGDGWLSDAQYWYTTLLFFGGMLLLPGAPAVAAWIAVRQGWPVVAWILGILGAAIAVLLITWMVQHWNRRPVHVTYTRQPAVRHLPASTWQQNRGDPWVETVESAAAPAGGGVLSSARAVAFAPSTDLARSRAFYEGVLGLAVVRTTPVAMVLRGGDVTVRLHDVRGSLRVQPFAVLGWEVRDVFAAARSLADRGVRFVGADGAELTTDVVHAVPDGTHVAWFRDPDGNILTLHRGTGWD